MLAGIGGRTVAEAKENLQFAEFMDWLRYRQMRGSFNIGTRLESGFALLAWIINRALGGKAEQHYFMPHAGPTEQQSATLGDVMAILSGKRS